MYFIFHERAHNDQKESWQESRSIYEMLYFILLGEKYKGERFVGGPLFLKFLHRVGAFVILCKLSVRTASHLLA